MNASEGDLRRAGGGEEEAGVVRAEAVEGLGRFGGRLGSLRRRGGDRRREGEVLWGCHPVCVVERMREEGRWRKKEGGG